MLPDFDENGHLPPGIHRCSFDEVAARFEAGSPERDVEIRELQQFIEWARRAGVRRMIINGSFVTDVAEPNDVDIVILPGLNYPRGETVPDEPEVAWPFLHVLVAVDDEDLERWALHDFGTDYDGIRKGVVEAIL